MKYTRKQFAALCGIRSENISNYIKRKKIVEIDGKIDGKNEQNAFFLSKRTKSDKPHKLDVEKAKEHNEFIRLDKEKKQAEITVRNRQARMMEIKEGKMLGEYLPTELVRMMYTQQFRSLALTMKDGIDQFIVRIAQKSKMNQNDVGELRKAMVQMINKAIERATLITEREIETQANDKNKAAA